MFAVWWVAAKFVPGGSALTAALVNCVVHVVKMLRSLKILKKNLLIKNLAFFHQIMYSYYAASAMGPRLKPYLWWKKYLTIIQLVKNAEKRGV